jgi:hypothetical protein
MQLTTVTTPSKKKLPAASALMKQLNRYEVLTQSIPQARKNGKSKKHEAAFIWQSGENLLALHLPPTRNIELNQQNYTLFSCKMAPGGKEVFPPVGLYRGHPLWDMDQISSRKSATARQIYDSIHLHS